jgi:hypothetical protein
VGDKVGLSDKVGVGVFVSTGFRKGLGNTKIFLASLSVFIFAIEEEATSCFEKIC